MHLIFDNNMITFFIVFLAGVIASIIWGISSGWGSLVSISLLLLLGLPPSVAVATDKFGQLWYIISTIYKFFKSKKIIYKYVIPLTILSIIWWLIWANLLIKINQNYLSIIIWIIIACLLPLVLWKKKAWIENTKPVLDIRLWFLLYFFSAIYDGFLGMAGGIFVAYLFVFVFGMTYTEANASEKIPLFFNFISSIIILAIWWVINYTYAIILFIWNLIWWYIWAHLAVKKWEWFVRIFFIIICIITAAKLIFFR